LGEFDVVLPMYFYVSASSNQTNIACPSGKAPTNTASSSASSASSSASHAWDDAESTAAVTSHVPKFGFHMNPSQSPYGGYDDDDDESEYGAYADHGDYDDGVDEAHLEFLRTASFHAMNAERARTAPWAPIAPNLSVEDFDSTVFGRQMIQTVLDKYRPHGGVLALNSIVERWQHKISIMGGRRAWGSMMKTRFHPAQKITFLTPKLRNEMDWMIRKVGLPAFSDDVLSLKEWILSGFKAAGILGVKGFIKTSSRFEEYRRQTKVKPAPRTYSRFESRQRIATKMIAARKTCRATFHLASQSTLKNKKVEFKYHPDRVRAIKCLSKLSGRMHLYWPAWISAKAAPIAKTGLVTHLLDPVLADMGLTKEAFLGRFPAAAMFITTAVSTFSERKAFTLKSHKQGLLNEYQLEILKLVKTHEPAALRIIALILPIEEIFSSIPQEDAVRVYQESMKWLKLCGLFYREQFFKGINKCVRRLGRVPPKGAKLNVTAVNNVADAWMNLRRFQTISAKYGRIEGAPTILKIMQLIADDQFRWGAGKIDPNAHVYKGLTTQKVYPWDAVLAPESFDIRRALTILLGECQKAKVGVESWIGIAKLRTGALTVPVDMIAGVPVAPMSKECADWLISMGLFGAHEWAGK